MADSPVFQSSSDIRTWKRVRGSGINALLDSARGGTDGLVGEIVSKEGSVHSAILTAAIDRLSDKGQRPGREVLAKLVQKARVTDCLPSIRAAEAMLAQGDARAASELLSVSARSQEVLHRSIASARIAMADGDVSGARAAAVRAYGVDPDCPEVYAILKEVDPSGGWGQRQNIRRILSGERPENPAVGGKMQELYSIYYEWYRGRREEATEMLVGSGHYMDRDPEFLLASARMSVDERDWRSAKMMYDSIADGADTSVLCEAAEANMEYGDTERAMELLSKADKTSLKVMRALVDLHRVRGETAEMMDAVRSLLDSEFSGKSEYEAVAWMLIRHRMHGAAGPVVSALSDNYPNDPEVLTLMSVLRMHEGDVPGAMSCASKAVRRDQGCLPARLQKARILMAMGRSEFAEKECDGVLRRDPTNRDALALMKDILMDRGEDKKALEVCERMLSLDPLDTDALKSATRARTDLGDGEGALEAMKSAMAADPSRDGLTEVIGMMISSGFCREAVRACREGISQFPSDPMMKRLMGNAQYALGDYMDASVTFASAAAASPHDPAIWHSKGMADEARGDYESAEEAYNRAVLLDLDVPEFWISKAAVQEHRGDLHGAVESLNRAIELDTRSVYALVRKSKIFSSAGRFDEAIRYLEMASVTSPDDIDILRCKVRMEVMAGRFASAVSTGRRIMALGGDSDDSLELALCHMRVNSPSEALDVLDSALRKDPDSLPLMRARAEALVSAGRGADALDVCRRITDMHPDDRDVLSFVADINRSLGKEAVAERMYGEIGEGAEPEKVPDAEPEKPRCEPEDPVALRSMAESLLEAGDVKGAARMADRALAAAPDDPSGICIKARVLTESGDLRAAEALLRSSMSGGPGDYEFHEILGDICLDRGDMGGALSHYDSSAGPGGPSPALLAKRGSVLSETGDSAGAAECYRRAVAGNPDDLDSAEALAGILLRRGDVGEADRLLASVLSKDPSRVSAIISRAEICRDSDDRSQMPGLYRMFSACRSPGADSTVRMVRILEETGFESEARMLMGGRPEAADADKSVKRYAEKAMRRAYTTRTPLDDPDILSSMGLDPEMSEKVASYLSDDAEYGRIAPGTDEFARMERLSHDIVMKMDWKDLEHQPRLPLEAVFVLGSFREADEAKSLAAYVFKVMHYDIGRKADPRLSEMSMRLPKGMTLFEIMKECDVGVYEAKAISEQII